MKAAAEKRIHQVFEASILAKGAFAIGEILGGLALALVGVGTIYRLAVLVTQSELLEDPADPIARFILDAADHLSADGKTFAALYLLSHGVIKLALIIALLRGKLWAYPASLVVFSLFIAYQIYRFTYTHSVGLVILSVFDLVVLWLVWHEWRVAAAATHQHRR